MTRVRNLTRRGVLGGAGAVLGARKADALTEAVRMLVAGEGGSFPAGALGVWMMDQATASPRVVVRNSLDATVVSQNMLLYSRRYFSRSELWEKSGLTIVDSNAVGPDGKAEASTISGTGNWYCGPVGGGTGTFVLPAGTWTVGVNVRNVSGTPTFQLGVNVRAQHTASSSWQRFSQTFTSVGAAQWISMVAPTGGSTAVFEIEDFEIYSGPVDLGPSVPGSHVYSGWPNKPASPVLSGGALNFNAGGLATIDLGSPQSISAGSAIFLVEKVGNGSNFTHSLLSKAGDGYRNFVVGEGNSTNQAPGWSSDTAGIVSTAMGRPDLWDRTGAGAHILGSRFNATSGDLWMNGNLMETRSGLTVTATSVRDLVLGSTYWGAFYSGYKIYGVALWSRYLSDSEMRAAYSAMRAVATRNAVSIPATSPEKLLFSFGDSITYGFNATSGNGYVYKTAATASPVIRGVNYGVSSYQVANVTSQLDAGVGAILAAAAASRNRKVIVSLFIGANDLGNGSTAPANATAFLASLATLCDKIRAYHPAIKLILCTILPRSSQADGGTQFNIVRNSANTTMRTWVGTHCDAIADFGDTGTTMGADGASNNGTYYTAADKVHPTEAGHVLLEPIFTAAVNAL